MKRRSVFVVAFTVVGVSVGGVSVASLLAGGGTELGHLAVSVGHFALAGLYRFHPQPIADPDEPAPRRWFELVGLIGATLIVSVVVLVLTLG